MPLDEQVSLDISDALRQVDTLESALTTAAQQFQVALVEAVDVLSAVTVQDVDASAVTESIDTAITDADAAVEVQALTDEMSEEIDRAIQDADTIIAVDADTAEAEAAIDDLQSAAEPVTVPVEADTAEAAESLAELGASADIIEGLGSAIEGVGSALGNVAKGGVGANAQLAALAGRAGPIGLLAGSVAVLGAGFFALGLEGANVIEVGERFSRVLGDQADVIENIGLDELGADLSEVAVRVGADDEAFRSFASRVVATGVAAGKTREEAAELAATIIRMSIALGLNNKELGNGAEIAPRLFAALQRGGRALNEFELSIPQAELKELSADMAATEGPASLFQRAMAGAAIAEQQVIDKSIDLSARADDLSTQFESTKQEISEAFEEMAVAAAPAVQDILAVLTPLVGTMANVADGIGDVSRGFVEFFGGDTESAMGSFADVFTDAAGDAERALEGVARLTPKGQEFAKSQGIAFDEAGRVMSDYAGETDDAADSTTDLGDAVERTTEEINALIDAQIQLLDSTLGTQRSADRYQDSLLDVTEKQKGLTDAVHEHGAKSEEAVQAQEEYDDAIRDSAEAALGYAQAQLRLAEDQAAANDTTLDAEQRYAILRGTLETLAAQASGPTKQGILDLLGTLDALPNPITLTLDVDTSPAMTAVAGIAGGILSAIDGAFTAAFQRNFARAALVGFTGFMAGGSFEGPGVFEVGERGRELVFVGQNVSGEVLSGSKSNALLAQGGGNDNGALIAAINNLVRQSNRQVERGKLFDTLQVNEVSGDPQTTAFSVATILGDLVAR